MARGSKSPLRRKLALLSPPEEAFCDAVARGLSFGEAAKEAGYKVDPVTGQARGNIQRLVKSPTILKRIEELRDIHRTARDRVIARMSDVNRENVLVDLLDTREQAKQQGNLVARTRCNELIGKEIGMFITRVEGTMVHALDGVSSDALRAVVDLLAMGSVKVIDGTTVEVTDPGGDVALLDREPEHNPTPAPISDPLPVEDDPLA